MFRRDFLKYLSSIPLFPIASDGQKTGSTPSPFRRVRPSDREWPSAAKWETLRKQLRGRLIKLESPLLVCKNDAGSKECSELFRSLKNPYFIGDDPALTQTSGWVGAWESKPSVYAVAAENSRDIAAAVKFARKNKLRLVVKGGGHSYQGTSCAPDSLLVWTRAMNQITIHDSFVGKGCKGKQTPQPAVSVGSGAIWMHTYHEVVTNGGRYVQGGGCATVGVAGLIQSGGFGSFSKYYGMAAAGLIEAEVVTADGKIRIANACSEPELFWGLKGGGGGSLGIITRLTLRTRELPERFGAVFLSVKASSDEAFKQLVAKVVDHYAEVLFNRHWGEQIVFGHGNRISVRMVFAGLDADQAREVWRPLIEWLNSSPDDYTIEQPVITQAVPARSFWDPQYWKKNHPEFVLSDDRPGAPDGNIFWVGDRGEVGQVLNAYKSAWLPASLLKRDEREKLVNALFESSRNWSISLHFNKGLAGASEEDIAAARDTATNPKVLDAFALAICASDDEPAFTGIPGKKPNIEDSRKKRQMVDRAMNEILRLAPSSGSYVSEGDFFENDWQDSFWGANYPRLAAVKREYDPEGLFFVHHGVGSEYWSADGFERSKNPHRLV
ncbi:FAD-binding protein [Leptolyngbya sp. 7M]|uniref:FAD-dependent oxidoreductase n=1 Tax=Leptolyngbya sp. 7M TaxID=2812896 RepID=UPI001B8D5451|nr:FAD-binding oxidoreductase [Leptolyngbya sp. 7M]QYO66549.1 FAD-binding oxidoreductase [Leptolyngbya sp. 7M]